MNGPGRDRTVRRSVNVLVRKDRLTMCLCTVFVWQLVQPTVFYSLHRSLSESLIGTWAY